MIRPLSSPWRLRNLASLLLAASATLVVTPVRAQALFDAGEVVQERFVLVAAPIGTSDRYQLNIYEQITDRRPCYSHGTGLPTAVNPLLATFDFTGICNRYIDANGYSLRVGGTDLATLYRLTVRNDGGGTLLVAAPAKEGAGPEMVIARSGGPISGFHRLQFEPGWKLMRRQFGGRRLGHLYVYSDGRPMASGQPPVPLATPPSPTVTAPAPVKQTPVPAAAAPKPTVSPATAPAVPASPAAASSPKTPPTPAGKPAAAAPTPPPAPGAPAKAPASISNQPSPATPASGKP